MEIVEIDVVRLEPPHRALEVLADPLIGGTYPCIQEELGGNDHVIPYAGESLAHDALVVAALRPREIGSIHLGRVKEGASRLIGTAYGLDAVRFVWNGAVSVAEGHAPHTDLRHLDVAQRSLLHVHLPSVRG
jgi:hypothetical protein